MAKVNIQSCSYRRQSPVGGIKQRFGSDIILWSEPFPFHNTPKGLHNVQMRRVWRNVEEKKSPFFPYWTHSLYFLITMYTCLVKDNKCLSVELERESVEEINNFLCIDRIAGAESFKAVIPVNHAKDVEPFGFFDRNVNVFSGKLPPIRAIAFLRHLSLGADVAFISIVEVDETVFFLLYEFLQLLGLIRIELRRGFPLRTFPYTSISRAKADKKALKVLSEASFPEACCHASFAFFTLCLSSSMALRTASSSEQSMIGFRPRPGRVSRPLMPSDSKRFTQELTDICVISVWAPTCSDVSPVDFRSTARQRMRYAWLLPLRKPSSSCRRCWSVSCITLIFAIAMCLYVFTQRYAKILI